MLRKTIFILFFLSSYSSFISAQHSVAREWNEAILNGIRNDFARPTVHARNLFHSSILMYDAWAAYDENAESFFLGNTIRGFDCPFDGIAPPEDVKAAREMTLSYAVYRLMQVRFEFSPGWEEIYDNIDSLMLELGYDIDFTRTDYSDGNPAALGNYMAMKMIEFGLQDGSNEEFDYLNFYYFPINRALVVSDPGNPNIEDLNRWQPLTLDEFVDQAGNPVPFNTPEFLSPEWGAVIPFALQDSVKTSYKRDGFTYQVYHDPGPPPHLSLTDTGGLSEEYKWGFALVSAWSSHLDSRDTIMWNISPASIGNISELPTQFEDYRDFYDIINGGDPSLGHKINPYTDLPYEPQMVPRADYARVLAEFWADGPDSETPPGHWFTILNKVNEHPALEKKFRGEGPVLDDLEWDVKSYFLLGGTMHDCAISAWGVKGWYDYIRPVSAIRAMADLGQSSDPEMPNYHPGGIPLIPGLIEQVSIEDVDGFFTFQDLNKIKLYAWRGPDFIEDPETDDAGVGWILADNWWPYQLPSFVTPPFAGYVSGHSTYSRGAAEILTLLTGDPFFPGGVGEFEVKKNEFLVFEEGPSVDMTLQWATYRDASNQASLSRIWGGIHPPADDIPGRLIGEKIGVAAFNYGIQYFNLGNITSTTPNSVENPTIRVYPNPTSNQLFFQADQGVEIKYTLFNQLGQVVQNRNKLCIMSGRSIDLSQLSPGPYWLQIRDKNDNIIQVEKVIKGF